MDPPIVVFEPFGVFKVNCSFCGGQAVGEVSNQGFLSSKGYMQEPDALVIVDLLKSQVVNEAIDDLSGCTIVIGVGGQCHKSRVG